MRGNRRAAVCRRLLASFLPARQPPRRAERAPRRRRRATAADASPAAHSAAARAVDEQTVALWEWRPAAASPSSASVAAVPSARWRGSRATGRRRIGCSPSAAANPILTPSLSGELASFGRHGAPAGQLRVLAVLRGGLAVSGCRDGELQLGRRAALRRTQAHTGGLRALAPSADGSRFASGGDDGIVWVWSERAIRLRRVDVAQALSPLLDALGRPLTAAGAGAAPAIVALSWAEGDGDGDTFVVGSRGGELHELRAPAEGAPPPPTPLQRPHRPPTATPEADELSRCHHALAAHPQSLRFATVGADGSVRLWALPEAAGLGARLVCWGQTPLPCAAVAFAPDGKTIAAAAARAPRLYLLDATGLRLLPRPHSPAPPTAAATRRWRQRHDASSAGGALVVRFSPSGALLAVGTIDGHVYLFDAAQGFLALGVLDGGGDARAAAVTALDWAAAPALRLRRAAPAARCACGTWRRGS